MVHKKEDDDDDDNDDDEEEEEEEELKETELKQDTRISNRYDNML